MARAYVLYEFESVWSARIIRPLTGVCVNLRVHGETSLIVEMLWIFVTNYKQASAKTFCKPVRHSPQGTLRMRGRPSKASNVHCFNGSFNKGF